MFWNKVYTYHVTYIFTKNDSHGDGTITMYRNHKINTEDQIQSVKEYIQEAYNFDNVCITNWIRLKSNKKLSEI